MTAKEARVDTDAWVKQALEICSVEEWMALIIDEIDDAKTFKYDTTCMYYHSGWGTGDADIFDTMYTLHEHHKYEFDQVVADIINKLVSDGYIVETNEVADTTIFYIEFQISWKEKLLG